MYQIAETGEYDLWLGHLVRPFSNSSPFNGQEFALLLVIADPTIINDDQVALSKEIVRQGCRFAVCTGHHCSKWDDSIDFAYLATSPDFSPSDEHFVMTTWHEDEPLEDVIAFFRFCTAFDNFTPHHYLALILGGDDEMAQTVSSSLKIGFGPHD